MRKLIHLIYCSTSTRIVDRKELEQLLTVARNHNARNGITGMLLYAKGNFFQVLEGEESTVDALFDIIIRDSRHTNVTKIIREPITKRSFGEWTMGLADITPQDLGSILGDYDVLNKDASLSHLGEGRAKKLLFAFKDGRWRTTLTGHIVAEQKTPLLRPSPSSISPHVSSRSTYTFAYQPIIDITKREIFSYEALLRGTKNEPAGVVFKRIPPAKLHYYDTQFRGTAIELAAQLGLSTRLNLNFLPAGLESTPAAITSMLSAAIRNNINPDKLVLEILEKEIIHDIGTFASAVNEYRRSGLIFAIDDFGSGYAGLNLLADFQPDIVKLDMDLVRGIERHGPRQAIVRGISRTCVDLGIDIIAEGVETTDEYKWLLSEDIKLYQGLLFAEPAFEQLSTAFHIP